MSSRAAVIGLGLATGLPRAAGLCDIYSPGDPAWLTTTAISPVSAAGVANANAQDTFCYGTLCLTTILYDQSSNGNHLAQAPPGGFDNLASVIGAPVTLNGQTVYGAVVFPGTGYHNNAASGTATGDEAEGMYAVIDDTHYNDGSCFDYGNAETNSLYSGNRHMDAIYFGTGQHRLGFRRRQRALAHGRSRERPVLRPQRQQ